MKKIYNKMKDKCPFLVMAITLFMIALASYGTVKFFATANKNELLAVSSNYERMADPNTMDDYLKVFDLDNNSRVAGRVWSDKTVFASGYKTENFAGNTLSLDMNTDGINGSVSTNADFLHVFSTIGSSQVVDEVATKPLDVVLLLDISTSMTTKNDFENDSLHQMLKDANTLINRLMNKDEKYPVHNNNRVGVVVYGGGAQTVLPIGHYTAKDNNSYIEIEETRDKTDSSTKAYFSKITSNVNEISSDNVTEYMFADSTYLQGALYVGMNMLATENEDTKDRTPVLIVLTDGATNIISATSTSNTSAGGNIAYDWWKPSLGTNGVLQTAGGNAQYSPTGGNPFYADCNGNTGNGKDSADSDRNRVENRNIEIQAIAPRTVSNLLLAGYYQNKIEANYDTDMLGFSIGFNIGGLGIYPNEQLLATLDPKTYYGSRTDVTKLAQDEIDASRTAIQNYIDSQNPTMRFPRDPNKEHIFVGEGHANFTWNHPSDSTNDIKFFEDVYYIDKYYTANTDELSGIFDQIFEEIVGTTFSPVAGENASGVSNSLTYMDPIGEYMEVKNGSVTFDGANHDMGLLLFGKMHGLVRTAVYDYQWNDTYMRNANSGKSGEEFKQGWYKGTPEDNNNPSGNSNVKYDGGEVPSGCSSAAAAWEEGWIYRIPWNIAVQYVSTLDATNFNNITETQKHTVYTIYRFEDSYEDRNKDNFNPCYEESANMKYKLSDIRVWVEDTGSYQDTSSGSMVDYGFDEALYVNIPVSALPIQVAKITLDSSGNVANYETNVSKKTQSTPFRLFYGVGVQEEIMTDDGLDIDATKLSSEYIKEHSQTSNNGDNEIFFLSNYYSNTPYEGYITGTRDSYTRGDPNFTFSPSTDNRYYVFQKPLILYKYNGAPKDNYEEIALDTENDYQEFLTKHENDKVTTNTDISKDSYYWIVGEYYTKDKKIVHLAVTRKGGEFGSEIGGDEVSYSDYLVWYNPETDETKPFNRNEASPGNQYVVATKKGGLRIGNMLNGRRQKDDNTTSTAYNYYIPTVSEQSTGDNLIINGYLGNNGKLVIPNTVLEITKEVEAIVGTDYSDEEFNYELYIADHVGDFSAVKMIRSPYADNVWQLRIDSIDVITDNNGLLQVVENGEGHSHTLYTLNDGGTPYYVYIGGDGSNEIASTSLDGLESEDDPYSFRLYTAGEETPNTGMTIYVDNPADYKSTGNVEYRKANRQHSPGTIEFWVATAYMIPKSKVDDGEWSFSSANYKKIEKLVISTLNPYEHGKDQLTSDFATNSVYGTTTLYFGYGSSSSKPTDKPATWSAEDWAWAIDPQNANKARFTLKDGEGIFLAGLPKTTKYTIYEKLTPEQEANGYNFGYVYGAEGREQRYEVHNDDNGVYEQSSGESGYKGQRDLHIVNTYYAHYDLVLDKTVLGTNGDTEKTWNFNIKLTPSIVEGSNATFATEYEYYGPCTDLGTCPINSEKLIFTQNEDGTYTATVSLKHNEKIKIINILADTKYEITEVEANQDGYESYTNNEEGYDEATGELNKDKHIGMINANWKRYDLTVRKVVVGSLGSKTRDFTFKITLTPDKDVRLAESYPYEGSKTGDLKFTKNSNGSYTATIKLKDSEYITIKGLPEKTKYEVVEVEADKNGYVTTIPDNAKGTLDSEDATVDVRFVNGKYALHDLTLEKIVRGATGDKNKEWTFNVKLVPSVDVIIKDEYSYVGTSLVSGVVAPTDGTIKFTKQSDGSYLGTVKLKHGQAITIKDIPENTSYSVTEVEANQDDYVTSDSGNTTGPVNGQHVRFTNAKLRPVDLAVTKEVKGENAKLDLDWEFEITLIPGAASLNTSYEYEGKSIEGVDAPANGTITFTENNDGTYTGKVTLKHGQSIVIKNLPETTKYIIKEVKANSDGYFTSSTDNKTGILESTGEESTTVVEVKFTNELLPNSSLTIAKEVLGGAGEKNRDWTFQIELTPLPDTEFETTYNYVGRTIIDGVTPLDDGTIEFTDEDGDGTYIGSITLLHGQAITILDLPTGTQFKVTEKEANSNGYHTSTNREVTGTIDGDTAADIIVFSNIKTINYDLKLSKEVVGSLGDINKEWHFKIRLIPDEYGVISSFDYDGSKNGTLEFTRQNDGSYLATISLKHNERITIRGIPENTRYSIEEEEANQDGYVTNVLGNATDFLTEPNVSVNFVNIKMDNFNLSVKKNVKGSLGDKTKEWHFRIELVRPDYKELETSYHYTKVSKDEEGNEVSETGLLELSPIGGGLSRYEAFITLKDGEMLTMLDLPEGTSYIITEEEANSDEYVTDVTDNATGRLVTDQNVVFTNSKYAKYDLTIEKVVTGIGDKNKDWNFDITLIPKDGVILDKEYNYVGSKNGTIQFTLNEDGTYTARITLKHGESITIKDIIEGTKYIVNEVEANQDDYETTSLNEEGELTTSGIKVVYTNYKQEEPPHGNVTPPPHTGVEANNKEMIIGYVMTILLFTIYLISSIKNIKRI